MDITAERRGGANYTSIASGSWWLRLLSQTFPLLLVLREKGDVVIATFEHQIASDQGIQFKSFGMQ